ncbi:GTP pyrophosphokinase [Bacteroides pyogenes JCM 10003]|nr:GTP pyrophosphokinase [Bacteroides pyogenes JCM 10003]
MFLGGLWHGASWNFVVWGMFHGIALALHKVWISVTGRSVERRCGVSPDSHNVGGTVMSRKKSEQSCGWLRGTGVFITFHFVCFCWIFFRNTDFQHSINMLEQIFTAFRPQLLPQLIEGYWRVFALMLLGFLLHFAPDSWEHALSRGVVRLPLIGKAVVVVAVIYVVIQMQSTEIQPFIYFQF